MRLRATRAVLNGAYSLGCKTLAETKDVGEGRLKAEDLSIAPYSPSPVATARKKQKGERNGRGDCPAVLPLFATATGKRKRQGRVFLLYPVFCGLPEKHAKNEESFRIMHEWWSTYPIVRTP